MFGFLKKFIKNGSTERAIRRWLDKNGFYGSSAKFEHVELHAIKRPGWLQVFRFSGQFKSTEGEWQQYLGAVRSDERYNRCEIEIFDSLIELESRLNEWSDGLIVRRQFRKE